MVRAIDEDAFSSGSFKDVVPLMKGGARQSDWREYILEGGGGRKAGWRD